MSISLMTEAFKTLLPTTQKFVFVALCDNANDQGECYPSISVLCRKTSLKERAVQGAIKYLVESGYMTVMIRKGRSTYYYIKPVDEWPKLVHTPRIKCIPARNAPPQELRDTPAVNAPPPPHQMHPTPAPNAPITIKKSSIEPSVNRHSRTRAAEISMAMRKNGVDSQPADPRVIAMAAQVDVDTVIAACKAARESKPHERIGVGYIVKILERWSKEAAEINVVGAKPRGTRDEENKRVLDELTGRNREADTIEGQARIIG